MQVWRSIIREHCNHLRWTRWTVHDLARNTICYCYLNTSCTARVATRISHLITTTHSVPEDRVAMVLFCLLPQEQVRLQLQSQVAQDRHHEGSLRPLS